MPQSEIDKKALEIQKCAEEIHCASALLANDDMFRRELQKDFDKERAELMAKLRSYKSTGDAQRRDENINNEINKFWEDSDKAKKRIYVTYAPLKKNHPSDDYPARLAEELQLEPDNNQDGSYTIVLPEELRNTIADGLKDDMPFKWTKKMLDAKKLLRLLTLHELYHIIDDKATEEDARHFSNYLLQLRKDRHSTY